jgi:hypothetical protein
MPFVRVGTSCTSTITGGTDYTFHPHCLCLWGNAGVLAAFRQPSVLRPQSIRGQPFSGRLPSVLPSRIRTMPFGLHRYEPVMGLLLLTRQGISLKPCLNLNLVLSRNLGGQTFLARLSLHVAMQMGPYLYPMSRMSGVWSLRILINSCLGFWRFIV